MAPRTAAGGGVGLEAGTLGERAAPPHTDLVDLLRARAEATPERAVFTFLGDADPAEGVGTLSFGDLDRRARALAVRLREAGAAGGRALLLYPPGLEFAQALFGCFYAGVTAVPVPPPEPGRLARTLPRLAAVAADAEPAVALTTAAVLAGMRDGAGLSPGLGALRWIATDEVGDEGARDWRPPRLEGDDLALIQYTSGSTASPKGVMLSHANALGNSAYLCHCWRYSPASVAVMWVPNFHDDGVIHGVLQPVYSGYHCLLLPPLAVVKRPIAWLAAISRWRATHSGGPNFIYALAVRKTTAEERQGLDLSGWETAYNAAEPIRFETLSRFHQVFSPWGFRWSAFHPAYGLAEATLIVSTKEGPEPVLCPVDAAALERHEVRAAQGDGAGSRTLVGCGRPILDTAIAIADPETGAACPPGRVGEVWVRSGSVARGYWRRPEETAATFAARLAGGGDRPYLRTGDLGFVRDGELYITGRAKDLIILRGRNLYPQDLELTAERSHPAVRPGCCAAFAVEAGEERLVIAAEVDPARGAAAGDLAALPPAVRRAVAEEHQVAVSGVLLLAPGSLPKTSSGKLQRRACRALFLERRLPLLGCWLAAQLKGWQEPPPGPAAGAPSGGAQAHPGEGRAEEVLGWLRDYSGERINSLLIDERRTIPPYVVLDLGNRGLLAMQLPRAQGGLGLGHGDLARVLQQLAAIDLSLAVFVCGNNLLGIRPIARHGCEALRSELLPALGRGRELAAFALTEPGAGSAVQSIAARAVPAGAGRWRLFGEKTFSGSAAWAAVVNVFCRLEDAAGRPAGTAAFAVRQGSPGLSLGGEALTMGLRGMAQSALRLAGVEVGRHELLGEAGGGMEVAQDAMLATRFAIAAMSVGAMKRCAQLMERYAGRRAVATGRLLDNPVTLMRLSELTAAVAALEAVVAVVADLLDAGEPVPEDAYLACKTAGPELLWRAADGLVQLLGGRGYLEPNEAPRMLRDARVFRIFEGPTEPLTMHLGSRVAGLGGELDRLLAETLGAPATAARLRQAAEGLAGRLGASAAPFADRTVARRWGHSLLGEAATYALLHAAAERQARTSQSAEARRAAEWAQGELEQRLSAAEAGGGSERILCGAGELSERVRAYSGSIGDIDQRMPGADREPDVLLRREAPRPGRAAAAPGGPPLSSPAEGAAPQGGRSVAAIEDWLFEWLARVLAMEVQSLDPEAPFAELGLDSVYAVELARDLERWLESPLEATLLWSFPTVESLARHLAGRPAARAGA